jgi:neurotransmitter:Na+ symporter, NSS family
VLGLPSAHAGLLPFWESWFGMSFLDSLDSLTAKWFLPLGGLLIAIFVGWMLPPSTTREEFTAGTKLGGLYPVWLILVRYVVPVAITIVFLSSIGLI